MTCSKRGAHVSLQDPQTQGRIVSSQAVLSVAVIWENFQNFPKFFYFDKLEPSKK